MPKMPEPGKQVKVWLPQHLIDALIQDAKAGGEKKIQPIIRNILGQHYLRQAEAANVRIEYPYPG